MVFYNAVCTVPVRWCPIGVYLNKWLSVVVGSFIYLVLNLGQTGFGC